MGHNLEFQRESERERTPFACIFVFAQNFPWAPSFPRLEGWRAGNPDATATLIDLGSPGTH